MKQIWLKLRSCHREALRRQKGNIKSGSAAITKKLWKFQHQMEFLLPFMGNRPREGNLHDDNDQDQTLEQDSFDSAENIEVHDDNSITEDVSTEPNITNPLEEHDQDVDKDSTTPNIEKPSEEPNTGASLKSLTKISAPRLTKAKKDDVSSIIRESMVRREKRAEERAIERKKIRDKCSPDDGLYKFFMSMYEITKKMTPVYQHLVRNRVYQSVSDIEAQYLQLNQEYPQNNPFQNQSSESNRSFSSQTSSVTSTPLMSPAEETTQLDNTTHTAASFLRSFQPTYAHL